MLGRLASNPGMSDDQATFIGSTCQPVEPASSKLAGGLQTKLAAAVCEARKLSPEVLRLFTEGSPDEVDLPDCTQLAQEDLIAAFTPEMTVRWLVFPALHLHLPAIIRGAP